MTDEEAKQWSRALSRYAYPVDLNAFSGLKKFKGRWFARNLDIGYLEETTEFEDRFRAHARRDKQVWFEVVFWKLFSLPHVRNNHTERVIQRCRGYSATDLWAACNTFVRTGTQDSFRMLQNFFVATAALPVVATFVAFADPHCYPTVDKWVIEWVDAYLAAHPNQQERTGLTRRGHQGALTLRDWSFYESWVKWCRRSAGILSAVTHSHWRARDVEMAVFQNSRTDRPNGLPLLPAVE